MNIVLLQSPRVTYGICTSTELPKAYVTPTQGEIDAHLEDGCVFYIHYHFPEQYDYVSLHSKALWTISYIREAISIALDQK